MSSSRAKGYLTLVTSRDRDPDHWSPSSAVLDLIHGTKSVLREYSGFGPMTVRQIFYRLVGVYGYEKTEKAYKRLAETLVKARRAQMISFSSIRDDGGESSGGAYGFETIDGFLEDLADYGNSYKIIPTLNQPFVIEMWCEAGGMVPMLAQMTRKFGILVTGTGGFSSVTVTHAFSQRVLSRDKPTVLLHVGDFDPSGESIFTSMCQDIGKFVVETEGGSWRSDTGETLLHEDNNGPDFRPRRVALTAEQVEQYDLPTAPPKPSDSRSANWIGETTQAEAMPPDLLESVVVEACEEWFDQDIYSDLKKRETEERAVIGSRVSDAINIIREEIEEDSE